MKEKGEWKTRTEGRWIAVASRSTSEASLSGVWRHGGWSCPQKVNYGSLSSRAKPAALPTPHHPALGVSRDGSENRRTRNLIGVAFPLKSCYLLASPVRRPPPGRCEGRTAGIAVQFAAGEEDGRFMEMPRFHSI